jgi:hypothetical protein
MRSVSTKAYFTTVPSEYRLDPPRGAPRVVEGKARPELTLCHLIPYQMHEWKIGELAGNERLFTD